MGPEVLGISGLTLAIVCVTLLCSLVVVVAAVAVPIVLMRNKQKKAEALIASGTQGEASILALEDTGMRINDDPRVQVLLEIRMPGREPYQLKKTVTIPLIRLSQVQVGMTVPVLVDLSDPANPDKVGLLLK